VECENSGGTCCIEFLCVTYARIIEISLLLQTVLHGPQNVSMMETSITVENVKMTLIAQATDLHVKMGPVFHVQQTSTAMEPRRTVDRIIPAKDA
jgi:hypothetical protein